MSTFPPNSANDSGYYPRSALFFILAYVILLVYGTLFPLSGWQLPSEDPWHLLFANPKAHISSADILTNVLVYIPLGLLVTRVLERYSRLPGAIFFTIITGTLLSLTLEYLQAHLPGRVPSILDTALNCAGTFIGAMLAVSLREKSRPGRWLLKVRQEYIQPGSLANLGLLVFALWSLSQLTPLVPSLDLDNLRQGIKPLWHTLHGVSEFDLPQAMVYGVSIIGLGLLADTLLRSPHRKISIFFGFVGVIFLLKVPVISRQISLEALSGLAIAVLLLSIFRKAPTKLVLSMAALAIIGSVAIDQLRSISDGSIEAHAFNWIPFRGHLSNNLIGLANILAGLWPFLALGYIALLSKPRHPLAVGIGGGLSIFALVFALEWNQQTIPGRFPDITDVLLALLAWTLPWLHPAFRSGGKQYATAPQPATIDTHRSRSSKMLPALISLVIATAAIGAWNLLDSPVNRPLHEGIERKLPAPSELPAVALPAFHHLHPRLPAPTIGEIHQLKKTNPAFLQGHKKRAKGGKGDFYSVTLSAFVEPGSQDLDLLHRRLMDLEFSWRGHQQTKPLALAYDWLYEQWTEQQRLQLRDKLVEGGNYLIERIREKRLSPYNVYLYNSPFQALMVITLALYGDDPRGEPIMRFTHDFWKNRVLPVWRQIMGHNGGWHEGGEYVGIGIGQAIYQVPAMWRKATGEDLFASESGIRGFLDFLVYRTRPDDTHFRWGDAGHFNNAVPDRIPLAIEYAHQAAYSLENQPRFGPTAWPWGPLARPELYNPDASEQLPLSRFFDGLGLLVARSDWSPQATYVTFKAGDNYWSHSHLDQGAFTIYKGGALAIDSGLYGPKYNSDHHMNYTYQTIAHNTVTVTDPDDRVPAPSNRGKSEKRYIANDGGQRRIGSGWGVEAAPLDLEEWEQKQEIYHTGTMQKVMMEDGLVVGVADVTPAYTNAYSGKETFSHRTRRVEQFRRTFGYDQVDDVVVIFDRVQITESGFRVRWLLHTLEQPLITPDGFTVFVTGETKRRGRAGGRLEAQVLLPRQTHITALGGEGFQFFVEDRNYDEDGEVERKALRKKDSEPGAWRVEVTPSVNALEHDFLVVLLPALAWEKPRHTVRLLQKGEEIGCEIIGPKRITRWWFDPVTDGVRVEIAEGRSTRFYDVTADGSEIPQTLLGSSAP